MMKIKAFNQLNKSTRSNIITIGIIILVYVICQIMIAAGLMTNLMKGLLVPFCYYSILAVSLNLTVGILGELSLGHAGFMCVGAFSGAFFSKVMVNVIENSVIRYILAILIGAVVAALFGCLIGVVVLRLRGDYLAIVTLAFGEIVKNIINVLYIGKDDSGLHFSTKDAISLNLDENGEVIVNGAKGIVGTPNDTTLTIAVILLILTYIIISNLIHSRSGRAIMAIRDNRIAAESVGIDITKFKILAFATSAAMAGIAGVLYSHNISSLTASPKNFGYNMSIMILVFVVLGGIGNIRGSIIAAIILTLLPEYLRFMQDYRMLIYAVVLIVMMIFNWNPTCVAWRNNHSLKKYLESRKKAKEA
ncbi:branched-chain amino acid ABC transporter permease [Lachnospiraceae bacterium MD1]|uniref:Branched-chain amino acid ABC transporter permease n=2 Tax=Variimorphobacter saccharofermentans TaxID=2755051 RepID=A0A839JY69_9FIRM|nr:branched-chain amino acid ABC transporter permease [Variimorphobacter saccharofermentans]MBB2181932.1 branched-chain amino acid ABC transporter permease [Variimorphobacter saccharofermentans]